MIWDEELTERKKAILRSIIDDYVQSASPVGSRAISRKHELGLSSATIRNEMSDLEELGFLNQPHTSAGRIPSDKGYRFYVDHLMQIQELAQDDIASIRTAMEEKIGEFSDLVRQASSIISKVTGYTTMVLPPQARRVPIKTMQVVQVEGRRVLVVVITSGGMVQNRLIRLDADVGEHDLQVLNNAVNERIAGLTLQEISLTAIVELCQTTALPDGVVLPVMECVRECMRRIETSEVILGGMTNLLNYPEFNDLLKARELMDLLREEDVLSAMLKAALRKHNLDMRIGSENELGSLKDLSLVTTTYGLGENQMGAIGVIGPTRMAYGRVVSSLEFVRKILDREILRLFGEG